MNSRTNIEEFLRTNHIFIEQAQKALESMQTELDEKIRQRKHLEKQLQDIESVIDRDQSDIKHEQALIAETAQQNAQIEYINVAQDRARHLKYASPSTLMRYNGPAETASDVAALRYVNSGSSQ